MTQASPLVLLLLTGALTGCAGSGEGAANAPAGAAIAAPLVEAAWSVRLADATARAPFEAHGGWALVYTRAYDQALGAFAADPGDGRALARVHAEYAALLREAARLAANAIVQVYGADRQPEDPAEVDYLVGASRALLGDAEGARAALAALPAGTAVEAQRAAWSAWLAAGAIWPPDAWLQGFPGQPGVVAAGTAPDAGALPHYRFAENAQEKREVSSADPTTLYLLSRWHEAAARQAAPQDAAVIDQFLAPWRLPAEPDPAVALLPVADAWLFGGFLLAPEDLAFLAAASGSSGAGAVETWKGGSPLAAAVAPAIEGGGESADRMHDQAAALGNQVEAAMAKKAGQVEVFHRGFADLARAGALRAAAEVADALGQAREAGVLRINALDRSTGTTADPVFFLAVAAWDTGNRNALRAQELLHGLLSRFPAAEASRYPLDALHLRLGRNAAPATPVF